MTTQLLLSSPTMARDEITVILDRINAAERKLQEQYEKTVQQVSGVGSDVKALKHQLEAHMKEDKEWKEQYTRQDIEWKDEMRPAFDTLTWMSLTRKGIQYVGLTVAGTIGFVYWLFNKT